MTVYKRIADSEFVIRLIDGARIPDDPLNRDWRKYQAWRAAGNQPLTADPAPTSDPRIAQDETERSQAKADATIVALINMTPAEIATAIDNAFADQAQRVILKRLARVAIIAARRSLRNG